MILSVLALCALFHAGDPVREAGELRTYQLQALLVPFRAEFQMQVLPLRGSASPAEEERERLDAGLLIEILRSLCAPEFEYEGRSLQEIDGSLYVTAPVAVQEKVAKILGFLGGALSARSELALDELLLPDALPHDPAPVLSAEEAQKLLGGAGLRRSWKVALRPGWIGTAISQRAIGFLSDWNCEIAQGAAIHDPIIDSVPAGDAIVCSGASAPGGMWLALLARGGESAGPKDHAIDFYATVASETTPVPNPQPNGPAARSGGRVLQAGPKVWQSVPVGVSALALNTFLPDGKVLCLSSTISVGEQRGTRLLFVRRANAAAAPVQGLAFDTKPGASRDLVLVDAGWLRPPLCGSTGDLRGGGALPITNAEATEALGFQMRGADTARAHELLVDASGLDVFDSHAWLVIARSQRTAEGSGLEAALARLSAGVRVPQGFSAEVALRRGSSLIARSTIALRSGVASTLVAGAEDELLYDWDVEVAQSAAVADPQMRPSFEGLCARLRVDRDAGGALLLQIRGFGQVRSGEVRNLEPQVPTVGAISLGTWDRLGVEEQVTLAADGPRKAAFGDTGGGGLVLEVTLGEVK